MKATLMSYPSDNDWMQVKRRALVTVGLTPVTKPTQEWKHAILQARHSPIRRLMFSFYLQDIPYWLSTELSRHHVGCEKYIKSQRNDRQSNYDRNAARQDAPVNMIWDINGQSLMILANKRLCGQARPQARQIMRQICDQVVEVCPEYDGLLVPLCGYCGGVCHEMNPCGMNVLYKTRQCNE